MVSASCKPDGAGLTMITKLLPVHAWIVAALFAAAALPAHSSGSNCTFRATGTIGLAFGTLDPRTLVTKTATATIEVGDCVSQQAMSVSVDQGLRGNRTMMGGLGSDLIAYSIGPVTITGGTAAPGNALYRTATFTGTVQGSAYANAVVGSYTDRLLLTVQP